MDYLNIISIILSALAVLFTLFLCIIAVMAFLGWQNLKDLKEKQKIFLTQQKKIIIEAEEEFKLRRENIKKLSDELEKYKSKIKTSTDFKNYQKRTEKLIDELKDTIREAEDKISNLRISASSSEISSIGGPGITITGSNYLSGLSSFAKKCGKCGRTYSYYPGAGVTLYSQCPYCGNLNY